MALDVFKKNVLHIGKINCCCLLGFPEAVCGWPGDPVCAQTAQDPPGTVPQRKDLWRDAQARVVPGVLWRNFQGIYSIF